MGVDGLAVSPDPGYAAPCSHWPWQPMRWPYSGLSPYLYLYEGLEFCLSGLVERAWLPEQEVEVSAPWHYTT